MIDWLTLQIDVADLPVETYLAMRGKHSLICQISPDGSLEWEKPVRRNVRSDSHQITVELCGSLRIYGSPARVGLVRCDNVFGSSDVLECAQRMIDFVARIEEVQLPVAQAWGCTRIDVTENYDLGQLAHVRTALNHLKAAEGGRYQVRTAAESVYWSQKSTVKSGKAYAKGPHMRYLEKRGKSFLSQDEIDLTDRLLRLELSLRRHWISRQAKKHWHELTEAELQKIHAEYFAGLIGSAEITEQSDMRSELIEAAGRLGMTEGQGRAAYMSWCQIQAVGLHAWKDDCPKSTFYRHKKIMFEAGLSWADLKSRKVVPLRTRPIVLGEPIRSWAELRQVA